MKYIAKHVLIFFVATLTLFAATPASADYLPGEKTAAEQVDGYEMVLAYLKTPQFFPSRLEFRKLSGDAVSDLAEIATNTRIKTLVRARAVQSLALYENDTRAVDAIGTVLAKTRPGKKLFPAALMAYAQVHGEDSAELISGFAEHRRSDVRLAAVIALGRFGGQDGFDALLQLKETEADAQVLETIESYTN